MLVLGFKMKESTGLTLPLPSTLPRHHPVAGACHLWFNTGRSSPLLTKLGRNWNLLFLPFIFFPLCCPTPSLWKRGRKDVPYHGFFPSSRDSAWGILQMNRRSFKEASVTKEVTGLVISKLLSRGSEWTACRWTAWSEEVMCKGIEGFVWIPLSNKHTKTEDRDSCETFVTFLCLCTVCMCFHVCVSFSIVVRLATKQLLLWGKKVNLCNTWGGGGWFSSRKEKKAILEHLWDFAPLGSYEDKGLMQLLGWCRSPLWAGKAWQKHFEIPNSYAALYLPSAGVFTLLFWQVRCESNWGNVSWGTRKKCT